MMEILFLGVGEACDPGNYNTSLLVKPASDSSFRFLLDCGFTSPHRYFLHCNDSEELQVLWISHFHGDHFFGVPLLLLRFWEMGRRSPFTIVGPQGVKIKVEQAMELAYSGFSDKLQYNLEYIELEPGGKVQVAGAEWCAVTCDHSQAALSLRINCDKKSLFYSGDGRPTPQSAALAKGCDLVVHEAFRYEDSTSGHGSVQGCIDFGENAGAKKLVLVHMERKERILFSREILALASQSSNMTILLPAPDERIMV